MVVQVYFSSAMGMLRTLIWTNLVVISSFEMNVLQYVHAQVRGPKFNLYNLPIKVPRIAQFTLLIEDLKLLS